MPRAEALSQFRTKLNFRSVKNLEDGERVKVNRETETDFGAFVKAKDLRVVQSQHYQLNVLCAINE